MILICLTTYNGSKYLRELLLSLENQVDNKNLEISFLFRDDGSIDNSYEILQRFAQNTSLHVNLLEDQTNFGVKKSFELLMNHALHMNAKYIMFCDQDDIWLSNKIAKTYAKIKRIEKEYPNLPLLIHSDLSVTNRDLHVIENSFWKYQNIDPSKDTLNRLLLHNTMTGCTMMINRTLAKKVNIIPQEAIMHDWWIALVASAFGKIGYINEPLILYRQHEANDTGAKCYSLNYAIKKLFQNPSFEKYIKQSKAFLEMYENDLDDKTREMLKSFSNFHSLNKIQKVILLFRYKIWKNGFLRNLGLILFA